jgi:uncharacterized protein
LQAWGLKKNGHSGDVAGRTWKNGEPVMKKTCNHLPKKKREELKKIASHILSSSGSVEMIVLFGSYARGDWKETVDLKHEWRSGHASDYDILVVTETREAAESGSTWRRIEQESRGLGLSTHIRIIAHDIEYLNLKLADGHYFFTEITDDGCLLYNRRRVPLSGKRAHTPAEKRRMAQDFYDYWFDSAEGFLRLYNYALADRDWNKAAFLLHQCAESAFKTVLLVFSAYSPHEHLLEILSRMAAEHDAVVGAIFPQDTREEQDRLELLDYAYIGARYDMSYRIFEEDLKLLEPCVRRLVDRTREICTAEIERLGSTP